MPLPPLLSCQGQRGRGRGSNARIAWRTADVRPAIGPDCPKPAASFRYPGVVHTLGIELGLPWHAERAGRGVFRTYGGAAGRPGTGHAARRTCTEGRPRWRLVILRHCRVGAAGCLRGDREAPTTPNAVGVDARAAPPARPPEPSSAVAGDSVFHPNRSPRQEARHGGNDVRASGPGCLQADDDGHASVLACPTCRIRARACIRARHARLAHQPVKPSARQTSGSLWADLTGATGPPCPAR